MKNFSDYNTSIWVPERNLFEATVYLNARNVKYILTNEGKEIRIDAPEIYDRILNNCAHRFST